MGNVKIIRQVVRSVQPIAFHNLPRNVVKRLLRVAWLSERHNRQTVGKKLPEITCATPVVMRNMVNRSIAGMSSSVNFHNEIA